MMKMLFMYFPLLFQPAATRSLRGQKNVETKKHLCVIFDHWSLAEGICSHSRRWMMLGSKTLLTVEVWSHHKAVGWGWGRGTLHSWTSVLENLIIMHLERLYCQCTAVQQNIARPLSVTYKHKRCLTAITRMFRTKHLQHSSLAANENQYYTNIPVYMHSCFLQ